MYCSRRAGAQWGIIAQRTSVAGIADTKLTVHISLCLGGGPYGETFRWIFAVFWCGSLGWPGGHLLVFTADALMGPL
jgi:hypothetical protein